VLVLIVFYICLSHLLLRQVSLPYSGWIAVGFQNFSSVNVTFKYNSLNSFSLHFQVWLRQIPNSIEFAHSTPASYLPTRRFLSGFSPVVIEMFSQIRLFWRRPAQFRYSAFLVLNSHFIGLNITGDGT
jgi:hypothetical protein